MYPRELTEPMAQELERVGFKSLKSADEVTAAIENKNGTTLVVVNSVCGCAAGSARPGIIMSLKGEKKPDHMVAVFAGVDGAAVSKAREYFAPYPPSSPSVALFKNGELVHFLERHQIECRTAQMMAENLAAAYIENC